MKLPVVFLLGCLAMTCIAYPTVQNGTGGIWESVAEEDSSGENRNHQIFEPMGENREQRSAKMIQPIWQTTTKEPTLPEQQQSEVRRRRQNAQMNSGQGQPLESTSEQPTTQTAQPVQQSEETRRQRSAQMNLDQGQPLESTSEQTTPQARLPEVQQSEEIHSQPLINEQSAN